MSAPLTTTEIARRRRTYEHRFPHRCDVWRASVTGTNDRGEVEYGAPAIALSDVRCHLHVKESLGEGSSPERSSIVREWRLHLPATISLLTSDEIRNVRDQFGDVLAAGPVDINEVIPHPSLTIAVLERVN